MKKLIELGRISRVCKTTALSIAAMMGANLLREQDTTGGTVKHDCPTCKHRTKPWWMYPCDGCSSDHDKWEGR